MRPGLILLLTLGAAQTWAQPQRGVSVSEPIAVQRKIALIIGNQAYPDSPLRNAINDAKAMAQTLNDLKFDEVTERSNLTIRQMRAEIDGLTLKLRPGDLVLFYYAGHGVQANEVNYLIPVDFHGTEADLPYEAYPAAQLRDKLEDTGARLRILILDACRNNPFRSKRDGTRGLSAMSAGEGTYIAYATSDNGVADDNPSDQNGLFTKELLTSLHTPGIDIKRIFDKTREDVYQASKRQQRPYLYDGVIGSFYFLPPPPPPVAAPPAPSVPDLASINAEAEVVFWQSVTRTDAASLNAYLNQYPHGRYAELAKIDLARLSPPAPTPGAPRSEPTAPETEERPKPSVEERNPPPPAPKPGEARRNPLDDLHYVLIPAGTFRMGCSPDDADCDLDEKPAHTVTISHNFFIGQTDVTVGAYRKYRAATGKPALPAADDFKRKLNEEAGEDRLPVVNVTWFEARDYCAWAGGTLGGRLPTEAEWEYAARATTTGARYGRLEAIAWLGDNSGSQPLDALSLWRTGGSANYGQRLAANGNGPKPVGLQAENAWHLFDMLGNVWQWVADWYADRFYSAADAADPVGPRAGEQRAMRGESWYSYAKHVRASDRGGNVPAFRGNNVGFRCVIKAEQPIR